MRIKNKTKENTRGVFLGVGFLIALSTAITAFEWKTEIEFVPIVSDSILMDVIEIIPITHTPPPEPPKPIIPKTITETDEPEIDIPEIEIDQGIGVIQEPSPVSVPEPEPETTPDFVVVAEEMPQPEGGYSEFYKKLGEEINYPRQARRMNIEGKVFVQFIVGTNGELKELQVIKGIGAGCDEEAVRALKKTSPWKPGKQRAVPVNVRMVIPITFKLQ